ncbi:hypothetical protein JHK84_040802 [Glycine max]|nr:hypothetical protein JHK84_040802 [Glycine max]
MLPRTKPKLTPELLLSDDDLGYALRYFPRKFKYCGRGHEFVHKVEKVAATRRGKDIIVAGMRTCRDAIASNSIPAFVKMLFSFILTKGLIVLNCSWLDVFVDPTQKGHLYHRFSNYQGLLMGTSQCDAYAAWSNAPNISRWKQILLYQHDDDVEIMFFRLARNPYIHCAKWYIIEEADSQSRADPSTYEPTQEDTNFTNAKLMLKMLELKKYNDSIRPYYHLVYGSINSEELVN